MKLPKFFLLLILLCTLQIRASIYVSPAGNDSNTGTIDQPLYTIMQAVKIASPGDTIFVHGGIYYYEKAMQLDGSGSEAARINIWAYKNEKPVMDGSKMIYPDATTRKARRGFMIYGNYYYIRGIEVTKMPDNGMRIKGSYIKVENCVFHHNRNTGLQIGLEGSSTNDGSQVRDNEVINCDSYHNCDSAKSGGDADGFACKLSAGLNNVFRNCRSWENSDDGWDLYQHSFPVEISNCITFHNGDGNLFPDIPSFGGNGNGFKTGGNGSHGIHKITNCISFNNKYSSSGRGFDQNGHKSGIMLYSCVSFNNKTNFYYTGSPDDGTQNQIKNNAAFGALSTNASIESKASALNNSWNISGITADGSDFIDTTEASAKAARDINGNLPRNSFMRLLKNSDLIDKGTDVGLPYEGTNPDLGAFEYGANQNSVEQRNQISSFRLNQNYPNPFNPSTIISYKVPFSSYVKIKVYDLLGKEIKTLVNEEKAPGSYNVSFDAGGAISNGIYFYCMNAEAKEGNNSFQDVKKMILLK